MNFFRFAERALVQLAAKIPLSWCVVGALVVLIVCVPLAVAAEEEDAMDVRREAPVAMAPGREQQVERAQAALRSLLAEIDATERELVTDVVRTALLRSGALREGES
jgi:hypothetical protein